MPNIRGPELLILVLVIVVLFGAKRLPDAARSVGRSLRIFKAETKGLTESDQPAPGVLPEASSQPASTESVQAQPTTPPAPPAPPSQA